MKQAPKKEQTEYQEIQKQFTNAKKSLKWEIDNACRKDYFFRIHSKMMKRQLERKQQLTVIEMDFKDVETIIEYQLEDGTLVQQVLCDLSKDLSPQEIVSWEILAMPLIFRRR